MQLPDDSIGITDILAYDECGRRFSFGMKRHTARAAQDASQMAEANLYGAVWARGYGSAIHEAISASEEGDPDGRCIQRAFAKFGKFLEPGDLDLLRDDLAKYHARRWPDTRTVANEDEFRVPLMRHKGRQIYFRFKLDRLLERVDAPGTFIHVDYKSSRHAKSEKEIRQDQQLWAYNWGIHEMWPECQNLLQFYDQLRYGMVGPIRKTAVARDRIRDWLVEKATVIIEDENWQVDGYLPAQQNQWCEWCPIMESCKVVHDLTDWALAEISARGPVVKDGRARVLKLDPEKVETFAADLEPVRRAMGILKRYSDSVTRMIKDMPAERREQIGMEYRERSATTFAPEALEAMHERMGERFYELANVTKTRMSEQLEDDPDLLTWALSLGDVHAGAGLIKTVND